METGRSVPQVKKCLSCGAEIPQESNFCLKCGTVVAGRGSSSGNTEAGLASRRPYYVTWGIYAALILLLAFTGKIVFVRGDEVELGFALLLIGFGFLALITGAIGLLIQRARKKEKFQWFNLEVISATTVIVGFIMGSYVGNPIPAEDQTSANATSNDTVAVFIPAAAIRMESLEEILDRAALITAVSYDLTTVTGGNPGLTAKISIKENNARIDLNAAGTSVVMVYVSNTATQTSYIPSKQIAVQTKVEDPNISPVKLADLIRKGHPSMNGAEVYEGKDCAVIKYSDSGGNNITCWVWKAKGLILKEVSQGLDGPSITEIKNISFNDIPDTAFQFPSGLRLVSEAEMDAALGQGVLRYNQKVWK